jgi:hypothetical protein
LSEDVEDGLASLCVRALDIVRETLEVEGLGIGSDFKKHQDNMALSVLKGRGYLGKDAANNQGTKESIPEELAKRIAHALEKSNEAAEYARSENEIVVEESIAASREGDFTLIES